MKALTIWQPWASLIMAGAKPWEWRGYPAPRSQVGRRIVIHAGKRPVRMSEIAEILEQLRAGDSSLVREIAEPLLLRAHATNWPLAAGLGTAALGEPVAAAEWAQKHAGPGYDSSRIDHHMFGWPLTQIESFEHPVPMRGAQGFWTWSERVPA